MPPSRPYVRRGRPGPRPKVCQRCGNGGHRAYEALTCPVVSGWLVEKTMHPADRYVLNIFDTETASICALMYIRTWFGDDCVYDLLRTWPFGMNFTKRARSCITLIPTSASSLNGDPLPGRNLAEDLVRDLRVRSCVRTLLANGRGPHFPAGGTVEPAMWQGYPFSAYDLGRQKQASASSGARLRWKLPFVNLFSRTYERQRRDALSRPPSASAAGAALVAESTAARRRRQEDEERKKARDRARAEAEQRMCVVCTTNAAVVAIVPCGHVCLCQDCEGSMRKHNQHKCPMCRTSIRDTLRIFT